jgi:hypothetical protein
MLTRNPPRLGEMLGGVDGLQKMISTGRDYLRLEHMSQLHAFTRTKTRAILGEHETEPEAVAA